MRVRGNRYVFLMALGSRAHRRHRLGSEDHRPNSGERFAE